MAGYRKIDPRIWNDEKFRQLSDDGKLAFLFLLTHPSLTCLGAMRMTLAGLAAELKWSTARFTKAISESKPMIVFIEDEAFIGFPNYLKYNEPNGPNSIIKAWPQGLDLLPEGRGRRAFAANCLKYLESLSDGMRHAIPDAILDAFRHAMSDGSADAISDAMPDAKREPCPILYSAAATESEEEKNPPGPPPSTNSRHKRTRHQLPIDFELTDPRRNFALNCGLPDPDAQFALFTDHWRATGGTMLNWDACWQKWCRNAAPGGRFAPRPDPNRIPSLEEMKRDLERSRQTQEAAGDDLPF